MTQRSKQWRKAQQVALFHHCRFAFETLHPRFKTMDTRRGVSINLTVNSGWE